MKKLIVPIIVTFSAITALWYNGPIGQEQTYHNFADQRCICSIHNAFDVLSNIPFALVGLLGLATAIVRLRGSSDPSRFAYITFFIGVILTCFGSFYYHLSPTDNTLVWDRLAMTIAFMPLLSIIVSEQIGRLLGKQLLIPLLLCGVGSIWYWQQTGDLRPYVLVQAIPLVLTIIFVIIYRARAGFRLNMSLLITGYIISKIMESFDKELFTLTNETISGHTLKHLVAAAAIFFMVRAVPHREDPQSVETSQ